MSRSFYWEPVLPPKGKPFSRELAYVLEKRYGHLGTELLLDGSSVEFLKGVAAAHEAFREEIEMLLDAIEKHGEIRVWAEY